jgi:hypothetical protein
MAVETDCPHCGAVYGFTSDLQGKQVKCDECAGTFVIGAPRLNPNANHGGEPEEGIKAAGDRIQGKSPSILPRVNDQDEPTSRRPIKKSAGCSVVQIVILLAVLLLLGGGFLAISIFGYSGGGKEQDAVVGIRNLESGVNAYYLDYQRYPNELADLTVTLPDGRPAKLPQTALIDPWNQPYQYEPKNLHPTTKMPRIWSSGMPGERRPITNW